jgi:hypothetical protein
MTTRNRIIGGLPIRCLLTLGALALAISGCPIGSGGHPVTPEQQAAIVKGKTTTTQVLQELGEPDQRLDLGNGKEQLSYISEKYTSYAVTSSAEGTEFWIVVKNGVVEDFGQRPTTKKPNYLR